MSHWTTVETEIIDEARLEEALDDLGIHYRKADSRIYLGNSSYAYLQKDKGKYSFVRDSECRDITTQDLEKIKNRYTFRKAVSEARTKGFSVVNEKTVGKTGEIKFQLKKIA